MTLPLCWDKPYTVLLRPTARAWVVGPDVIEPLGAVGTSEPVLGSAIRIECVENVKCATHRYSLSL